MPDFENIYELYFKDVYRFVLSLTQNESIAEEITQETFFKALKSIDQFNGSCKVNVWLCQIAKNTYFSYTRKEKRITDFTLDDQVSETNIERSLAQKDEALLIHKLLHALDEPYKEVFSLRVFAELSFSEIGNIFGKTESWSRVTFHRGKRKIQELMREEKVNG